MKKEYVVHENGALPLLLTGKDIELSETDWYKNTVSFVRGATSAHVRLPFDYGEYDDILNHLIPRIIIDTPDLDQLQYGWDSLEGLEEDTLAKKTLLACSEYDEDLSERYLKQWIMESFKVLFDGARETVESYDPNLWYISGINVSLSPVNTLLCFEMVSKGDIKKTSDVWEREHDIRVIDPDGWDRTNFDESWKEEITEEEFLRRVSLSTTAMSKNRKPLN